jgi:hypothetical protein
MVNYNNTRYTVSEFTSIVTINTDTECTKLDL